MDEVNVPCRAWNVSPYAFTGALPAGALYKYIQQRWTIEICGRRGHLLAGFARPALPTGRASSTLGWRGSPPARSSCVDSLLYAREKIPRTNGRRSDGRRTDSFFFFLFFEKQNVEDEFDSLKERWCCKSLERLLSLNLIRIKSKFSSDCTRGKNP